MKLFHDINEVEKHFEYRLAKSKIRFWEKSFPMLKPEKNRAGDRQYTQADIELLEDIFDLVENQGFTHQGAVKLLEAKRLRTKKIKNAVEKLEKVKVELENLKFLLEST